MRGNLELCQTQKIAVPGSPACLAEIVLAVGVSVLGRRH